MKLLYSVKVTKQLNEASLYKQEIGGSLALVTWEIGSYYSIRCCETKPNGQSEQRILNRRHSKDVKSAQSTRKCESPNPRCFVLLRWREFSRPIIKRG